MSAKKVATRKVKRNDSVGSRTEQKSDPKRLPNSAQIAGAGIQSSVDFARCMSAIMGEVLSGETSPVVANAACNAGGKLLKVVEMQEKYGSPKGDHGPKTLELTGKEGP